MKQTKLLLGLLLALAFMFAPASIAQERRTPQARPTQDVSPRKVRRLEARIATLEAQVEKILAILEKRVEADPPQTDPPVRDRPRRDKTDPPADPPRTTPPPRGPPPALPEEIHWEPGATTSVSFKPRDREPQAVTFKPGAFVAENADGIQFRCYTQSAPGLDAWMVTVGAVNGYRGRGVFYFEKMAFVVNGELMDGLSGRHVILPRGAIWRRFFVGPDADELSRLAWMKDDRPTPAWAPSQAAKELGKFQDVVGPYKFHWKFDSLQDSHGGNGVAPFHGGPDDWLTCPEGRQLRQQAMLSSFQRPVWQLGPIADEPYWMGRTIMHRLKGYDADPDGWCAYAKRLAEKRPADHTHLTRQTGGAAALARWDLFARDSLMMIYRDFKIANSMTREDEDSYRLLLPLDVKVERANGPLNSEGDRGLAHMLRLMRWCRPYANPNELSKYEDLYRQWTRKLASPLHGYTRYTSPTNPVTKTLEAPYIQAFHQMLNLYEFRQFGGLDDIADKLARYLTPNPPWYFEVKPVDEERAGDNSMSYNWVGSDGTKKLNELRPYGAMTHGVPDPAYGTPAEFLASMAGRGCDGSSQELDCTPRSYWEAGL